MNKEAQAEWYKPTGMMPPEFHHRHRCSNCRSFALYSRLSREELTPYCPYCGKQMKNGGADK